MTILISSLLFLKNSECHDCYWENPNTKIDSGIQYYFCNYYICSSMSPWNCLIGFLETSIKASCFSTYFFLFILLSVRNASYFCDQVCQILLLTASLCILIWLKNHLLSPSSLALFLHKNHYTWISTLH